MSGNCEYGDYCSAPSQSVSYRPRGALARAVYQRHQLDKYLTEFDKNKWYHCDLSQLPPSLASKFVQLEPDKESMKFLEKSEEKSNWIFVQIWHVIAKSILSWFMTQTSINGWLQRGSMFVVSTAQFLRLLRSDGDWHRESLIDLGAGDGAVTAHLSPLFEKVYVTEVSDTMRTLLQKRGFQLLEIDEWNVRKKYDVIACLNLVDRCNTPMQLLKQIREALNPDGFMILALVLPFSAYVELGTKNHRPEELLPIIGSTFEEQVVSTVQDFLEPNGFTVESWSRVPYLCEGDLKQSYYWLDDAIFILRPNEKCDTRNSSESS